MVWKDQHSESHCLWSVLRAQLLVSRACLRTGATHGVAEGTRTTIELQKPTGACFKNPQGGAVGVGARWLCMASLGQGSPAFCVVPLGKPTEIKHVFPTSILM